MDNIIDMQQVDASNEYVIKLLLKILQYHSKCNLDDNNSEKYYYQYETCHEQTLYEQLMNHNMIVIKAKSYQEAMILNTCLRIIIDGHGGYLLNFVSESEETLKISFDAYFKSINESKNLSEHENFISDKIKEQTKHVIKYRRDTFKNSKKIIIKNPIVYDFNGVV
jgi:hypothetical protein